ncbi:DUF1648 domain-containing protein [Bacillus tuaregi]|uniref:DUF1648 domain-containing protein n=1 Tax=Bacillus tuaregi TaxID=1816695 RepID=UPI0008F92CFE|nr:DUF5808 domain-containing protein [Bacillus tuaregi]
MAFVVFFILILFLAIMESAIPFLVKRTVVFGVSVPERFVEDAILARYKKTYSIIVATVSIAALALFYYWYHMYSPMEDKMVLYGMILMFSILILSFALYFFYHGKTAQRKKAEQWGENAKQLRAADLSARAEDEMLPWYIFLLPMLITVAVLIYTIIKYPLLPAQIPTHWGISGKPDAFTEKTPVSAIQMPLILLVMQAMMMATVVSQKRSGIKVSATNTAGTRTRQLTLRKYTSWFMFLMTLLLTILFSFFQLSTIHTDLAGDAISFALPMIFMLLVLVGTLIFALKVGRSGKQITADSTESMEDYDDDQYWKGGLFYFNKSDPSIFVEKRFGVGWTLNFANPIGYFIIFVPITIILLLSFL